MRKKIDDIRIAEYLFLFSLLLTEGTMYGALGGLENSFYLRLLCLGCGLLLLLLYLLHGRLCMSRQKAFLCLGVLGFFAVYLAATRVNVMACLEGLVIPFFLFLLLGIARHAEEAFGRYLTAWTDMVTVLAAVSLFFYFGGTVLHLIPGQPIEYYNNGVYNTGTSYFYLSFINDWQTQSIFGRTFVRNVGIFMEAPGYAFPLAIALFWSLFGYEKPAVGRAVLLGVTMVTTFSTEALVVCAGLILLYLYSSAGQKSAFWRRLRWFLLPVLLLAALAFVVYVLYTKVSGENSDSVHIRLSDLQAAFAAWTVHPLFGSGFYNLEAIYAQYETARDYGNPTAGLMNVLAYGGLYMFTAYAVGFARLLRRAGHTENGRVVQLFTLLLLLFLCMDPYQYSYFVLLLLAMSYAMRPGRFAVRLAGQRQEGRPLL